MHTSSVGKKSALLGILLVVFLLSVAGLVYAQGSGQIVENTFQINVSPSTPRPGQVIYLSINSYSFEPERSTISWYVNNSLRRSGVGQTALTLVAGATGSTDVVRAIIQPPGARAIEKTVSIRPADVLVMWQAEGYTPPFYKGKTLHTAEGGLTLLAVPDIVESGRRIPSRELVFTWEQDGVALGSKSGVGRDVLTIPGSVLLRPITVFVDVETLSGSVRARKSLQIPVSQPILQLYENHPTLGILFNNALTNTTQLINEETTIEAYPYFFSERDREAGASYEWRLGGRALEQIGAPRVIVRQGDQSGNVGLSVSVQNTFSFLEAASANITLKF